MSLPLKLLGAVGIISSLNGSTAPLKRLPSTPFPPDFKAWEPKRILNLEKAAIVRIDTGELAKKGLEEKVQDKLQNAWSVSFPIQDYQTARMEGRPLILVGKSNGNMILRRLAATKRILPAQKLAETRVIPELFDWKTGAVFLGGATEEAVLEATDLLVERFKEPDKLSFLISCKEFPTTPLPDSTRDRWIDKLKSRFLDGKEWLPRTSASYSFEPTYQRFLQTGDEVTVRTFAEMLKIYEELYFVPKGNSDRPPTFAWHEIVWEIAGMEDSPAFTAEDRARAARLTRMIGEDTMNYWEMSGVNANYDKGIVTYYTNHPIFASRTSYFSGEYLLHRYNYEPARYWMASAHNAMVGVEPHAIGPEDAPGYHHLCTTIFINYALASGNYDLDFFHKPEMQDYFVFTKAQWGPTMRTPGYGDSGAMGGRGAMSTLGYAVDIFDDQDSKAILSLIGKRMLLPAIKADVEKFGIDLQREYPISDRYNGLNLFTMDDFRLKQRNAPKYEYPILDKAYFRTNWDGDSDFLATSGLNRSQHGHCDLNAILQYTRGRNIWLTEGHYILYGPEEHNTLSLQVNGRHVRPNIEARGALGQVRHAGMVPSKRFAVTRVTAEEFGPCDWTRTIVWNSKQDFWVIDELYAREPGEYQADYRWRSLGEMRQCSPQCIEFRQLADNTPIKQLRNNIFDPKGFPETASPTAFYIHGGDAELELSSQQQPNSLDAINTAYYQYSFADPVVRVVLSRQRARLKAGDVLRNAHFFSHREPVGKACSVRKLGEGAWMMPADGETGAQLVLMGSYQGMGIDFDGAQLFVGPNGIIGFGVRSIAIGSWSRKYDSPTDIALDEVVPLPLLASQGRELAFVPPPVMEAPAISVERAIEWKDEICSLVAGRNGYGVGDAAGGFSLVCRDGVVAWRTESQGAAVAVCPVSDLKGNEFWVVGYDLKDVPKPESHWRIYDGEGKELCGETSNFGRITTIFPFRCNESGEKGFIIGTTGWMALAYDLTGKRLWTFKCYHNMICGAAADCNQDGADEILLGAGYYYHQMLNAKGKMLFQRNCDAWNYDVAVTDINGDGIPEFICGREDDAVHVMTPLDTKPEPDIKPLKLGGVPIKLASCANGFAVAVENGAVVRVGTGMSLLWSTELPSGLAGLAEADDHFYTVCRDGYLYRLDGTGKVTGKLPFATNSASYYRPIVVAGSLGLAASSGHRLIMLK